MYVCSGFFPNGLFIVGFFELLEDEPWMKLALELAARGRGFVEPNPMVGAVVVQQNEVVGLGWHEKFGGHHAEINALNQAGNNAKGSTLYVTLEPCCHHGKTPPCVESIIRAGVSEVVFAMEDPNPLVAGKGLQKLQEQGIKVSKSLLEKDARFLNAPFIKSFTVGKPFVIAKWAMTLDGKIATYTGESKWISNPEARKIVHELRGRVDGILVGIGTVLKDDPMLTVRPAGARTPLRIILDPSAKLPLDCQLFKTAQTVPVLMVVSKAADPHKVKLLKTHGIGVLIIDSDKPEIILNELLEYLGSMNHHNLLVEGGSTVLGHFWDQNLIDECHIFVGTKIIGGGKALSPISGIGFQKIPVTTQFEATSLKILDDNFYFQGRLAKVEK